MDDSGTNLLVEDNQNDVESILASLSEAKLVSLLPGRAAENSMMILLDFNLPKVDGLEILQRIKSDPDLKATPVVTLTSSREERDMPRSYNLGTNAYVVKPMRFRFFTQTVNEVGLNWEVINQPPSTAERES